LPTPTLEGVLYGIKPVVIAIVIQALAKLIPTVAKTRLLAVLAAGAVVVYLLGVNELIVVAAGGATAAGLRAVGQLRDRRLSVWLPLAAVTTDVELGRLFLTFLRRRRPLRQRLRAPRVPAR
jgi:chromate transporter